MEGSSLFRIGKLSPVRESVGPGTNVASYPNVHNQAQEHTLQGRTDPLI